MNHYVSCVCCVLLASLSLWLNGQTASTQITVTGNPQYCQDAPTAIVSNVSITDTTNPDNQLNQVTIQISEGYAINEDVLSLQSTNPGISSSWSVPLGTLTLIGPASLSEFELAIANVVFSTNQNPLSTGRSFSINLSDANFLPSTGHYYRYVPDLGITWTQAQAAASTQTFFGLQGYLTTLTTLEEAQLVGEQTVGAGWIGATDAVVEGVWRWVTGPEAGTQFWQGNFAGNAVNGEFSFWNSGEPNNVGVSGEDYAHITDPSIGIFGSWNDLPNEGDQSSGPTNPFFPKGYIVEFGGMPGDPVVNLSASATMTFPQTTVNDGNSCEAGAVTISVTTNTDEVLWYATETSTIVLATGITYTPVVSETTSFWVLTRFSGCADNTRLEVRANVNLTPEAQDITIQQCDDTSNDGNSSFQLDTYLSDISSELGPNVDITFFEDQSLSQLISTLNYTNQTNNQIIYAQVENITTGCFNVAEVTLIVSQFNQDQYIYSQCDDTVEDGITNFVLADITSVLTIDYPAATAINYFLNYDDALQNQNPLSIDYRSASGNTIYAKLTNDLDCLGVVEVLLAVLPLPEVLPDETRYYCLDTFPDTIILEGGAVGDIPNNFYYNWSTGETTIAIAVNEPGTYTVTITDLNGNNCSKTRTIEVLGSSIASIDAIEVQEASDTNRLVVQVSGSGDYEYALDVDTGPYQDSNVFENVTSGIRTIYVNDKNGCGIVSENVTVIEFPKFFTPNGDSQNDIWQVDAFQEEFFQGVIITVFNRYGKVLTQLSASQPFWDGTYNGTLMPADDYWFYTELQDGTSIARHFSLKR